jgi:polar amino acid transport system substrate-binding protein
MGMETFEPNRITCLLQKAAFVVGTITLCAAASAPAHADLLQKIKDRGYITIGTEARYAPFEYIDKGKIVGYDRDLLDKVMEGLPKVKVKTLDLPWQGLLPGRAQGKLDFVVTAISVTKERASRYAVTVPVADATVAFVKRADDGAIKESKDIVGKVVGTQIGSGQLKSTQEYDETLKKKYGKGIAEIKQYVGFDEAYADLLNRRTDAVAQSLPPLLYLQKQHPTSYKVILPPFGPKLYFSWAGRNDADSKTLVEFFNNRLKELNHNGTMKKLEEKWFGFTMEVPDHSPTPTM